MKHLLIGGLVLTLILLYGSSPAARGENAPAPTAEQLVRQLGSQVYAERQDAAVRLALLGRDAVAALRAGLKEPDREIRGRCAELLPRASRSDLEIQLDDFVADGPSKKPLTGWVRFKEMAGDDASSRRLFADLYRAERGLLEQLEKDPKQVASQVATRSQQVQQYLSNPSRTAEADQAQAGSIIALLVASAAAPTSDMQGLYSLNNLCYQPPVRNLVSGSAAARRLMSRALVPRLADPNGLQFVANMATQMNLTELLEERIRPAVRAEIETSKPDHQWKYVQAVYLANQLQMHDLIETKIKPAVRKLAETAITQPDNQGAIYQVLNLVQVLQMQDALQPVLKPAAVEYMRKTAEQTGDLSRMYQARYLAQSLGMNDAFDAIVKPAVCRVVADCAAHPEDQNKFQQALSLVQAMNLEEAYEGVLRPVGRRKLLADLEKNSDLNSLNNAAQMARQLRINDLVEDTLKPLARRQAAALLKRTPNGNEVNQVYMLAQTLAMPDLTEDVVKPAVRKLCQAGKGGKPDAASFSQLIQLVKNLRMKEAVPLAVQGALAKEIDVWARSTAILFVSEVGAKEDLAKLEPLLKDTADCGACGINSITVHAQVRDVVLAALVSANGQDLADYGFPYFRIIPGIKPADTSPSCMGFSTNDEREAALKKWQAFLASRKK